MSTQARPTPKNLLWVFPVWLVLFYSVWLTVVLVGKHARTLAEHWPIMIAMAGGSYVAGSTPMGGGTIGFPILTLLLDQPATLGRDFSFAIQSIGMVSAGIFILSRRQPIEWPMLRGAMVGSLVGTPIGIFLVAPLLSSLMIKVVFAVIWASFGVLHLHRINELSSYHGITPTNPRFDHAVGFALGLGSGATVSAITGVGIDMVLYAVLVLVCHADLKIAIPTSVLIMAFTSVLGITLKFLFTGVEPGVFGHWLAAAPIVALGAPFGALIVHRIGRKPTLVFVSKLCLLQFIWTCYRERAELGWSGILLALAGVIVFLIGFDQLRRAGFRLARRKGTVALPP